MRPKEILIDPINVDADGLAEAQAVAGAGALTLDGALIADSKFTADYARRLGILSAGNDAGITFTVVGTDPEGKALTEVVTGAAGAPGTAETVGYFQTVTSVTASGAAAGNVSVGTVDEFVTNVIPLNHYNSNPATISFEDFTGTIDISTGETFSRLQYTSSIQYTVGNNKTAAASFELSNHATGVRLICNSYTNGAELKMIINQNRER